MISVIAFLVATLADIWTTNRVIESGGRELNPIVRVFMDRFGKLWFWPKLAFVGGCAFAVHNWQFEKLEIGVWTIAAITAFVALNNYLLIGRK